MIFRIATILDHTGIVLSLLEQIENRLVSVPPANNAISTWVNHVLLNGFVAVAEEGGRIIGTVGMGFTHFPWNDEIWIMNNDWFHVHKDYRVGDTAKKLIEMVKDFADDRGIIARFDIINDRKVDKIDRFLEIQGMRYMGGNFLYGVTGK